MDGEDKSRLALNILYEFSRMNYSDIHAFVPTIKQSRGLGPKALQEVFSDISLINMTKKWACLKLFKDKCPRYEQKGNDHTYSITDNLSDLSVTVRQQPDSIDLKVKHCLAWSDSQPLEELEHPKTFRQLLNSLLKAAHYEASYETTKKLAIGHQAPVPFFYREPCFMFGGQLPLTQRTPIPVKIVGEMFNGFPDDNAKKVSRKGQMVTYTVEASVVKPKEYTRLHKEFL